MIWFSVFILLFNFAFAEKLNPAEAKSNLKVLAQYVTPYNLDFKKTKIGGLSGLYCEGNKVWAVSDDRGQKGAPRFYEFEILYVDQTLEVLPKDVHEIKAGKNLALPKVLDLEAISKTLDGDFILSSEGDLNKVPRVPPSFLRVSNDGVLQEIYPMPEMFMPELAGKQKKGVQNNEAFEGMRWNNGNRNFWALHETALVQDYDEQKTSDGDILHFVNISTDGKIISDHPYKIDPWTDTKDGKEILRGVSEILEDGNDTWWVLERGVRIQLTGMKYTSALYKVNKDFKKEKVLDFDLALASTENFEGLCHGPEINGKKTLLMVSDNNFSKRESTRWVLLSE